MTLSEAQRAERRAFADLVQRVNEGILREDPKVPVLRLIGEYRKAVETRKAVEIRDAVLERTP